MARVCKAEPVTASTLNSRTAFDGLPLVQSAGNGVIVLDRDGLALATVLVRKGQTAAFAQRVRDRFAMELAPGLRRSSYQQIAFIATGPNAWLATSEAGGNAFAPALAEAIGDLAAVSDQSDGYAVLRLSGRDVRAALCKLIAIDIHPRAFNVNDVASTIAAHSGVTLWRLDDAADGSSVFEVAIYRSLARSFWGALSASAAEFGVRWQQ